MWTWTSCKLMLKQSYVYSLFRSICGDFYSHGIPLVVLFIINLFHTWKQFYPWALATTSTTDLDTIMHSHILRALKHYFASRWVYFLQLCGATSLHKSLDDMTISFGLTLAIIGYLLLIYPQIVKMKNTVLKKKKKRSYRRVALPKRGNGVLLGNFSPNLCTSPLLAF